MSSNDPTGARPGGAGDDDLGDAGTLVVEDPGFAIVGEWVITAEISDAAFRVYSMLLRFGNTSGTRMPSRALLGRRLHRSVDSIDRALRELQSTGLVRVEHRHDGRQYRSNRYHVRTSPPSPVARQDATVRVEEGGRTSAATRGVRGGGRTDAATPGRRTAARVAAGPRPYPDPMTQTPPPPATPTPGAGSETPAVEDLLARCGIDDLDALAARCAAARAALGKSANRWAPACLLTALQLAVVVRGWPAHLAADALLQVAADPATRSPARLAEAGPWWDVSPADHTGSAPDEEDLAALEARLAELGGQRPALQARARAELATEHLPVTRATVTRRAIAILDRQDQPA